MVLHHEITFIWAFSPAEATEIEIACPGDEACCSSATQDWSILNTQLNYLLMFCFFSFPTEIQFERMPSLTTRYTVLVSPYSKHMLTDLHRQMKSIESCTSEQKAQRLEKYHPMPEDTWVQSFTSVSDPSQSFLKWHFKFTFFLTVTHTQC